MTPVICEERFSSQAALHRAVETLLREEFERPGVRTRCVVLSGGNTPLPAYRALAARPPRVGPDVHAAFTDERYVPPEAPESNYGAVRPMLDAMRIPDEHVLRVHTELPIEAAAERFHIELESFIESAGEVSLALLGLGADGHTCSLFGPEDLERADGRYALAVQRPAPPHRVSVGPCFLEKAARIVLIVSGRDKAEVLRRFLDAPDTVTAGQALKHSGKVEVWHAGVFEE